MTAGQRPRRSGRDRSTRPACRARAPPAAPTSRPLPACPPVHSAGAERDGRPRALEIMIDQDRSVVRGSRAQQRRLCRSVAKQLSPRNDQVQAQIQGKGRIPGLQARLQWLIQMYEFRHLNRRAMNQAGAYVASKAPTSNRSTPARHAGHPYLRCTRSAAHGAHRSAWQHGRSRVPRGAAMHITHSARSAHAPPSLGSR